MQDLKSALMLFTSKTKIEKKIYSPDDVRAPPLERPEPSGLIGHSRLRVNAEEGELECHLHEGVRALAAALDELLAEVAELEDAHLEVRGGPIDVKGNSN